MSQVKKWSSAEVRRTFLNYFQERAHTMVPSAPIVIKDDPSLMFTNAGMNQFKDFFLGNTRPTDVRVVDTQKCLRVSGKHNDLEEVGHDTYHHTMFEMLGNWSFGDYFKQEAIDWAWDLLINVYGIDKSIIYATVFEGDAEDGSAEDQEAREAWLRHLPKEQILNGNKKDNFWEMGASGPCGPSSEIHVDLRSEEEKAKTPGAKLVNMDHPQVVEVWNLVFMEFNRLADGSLKSLPQKHVDTGMGFERLCMALQGVQSNYDTDVFSPIIQKISKISSISYGKSEKTDIAIRVIADHVRAVAFAIADGQLPSNTGAGYVIRRILRRAIRYGFSYLNQKEAFIYKLVDILAVQMGEFFPEIVGQKELVTKVIHEEENSFLRTLEQGLNRLSQIVKETEGGTEIDGLRVFELYDTFGFPPDLTALILKEQGLSYNEEEYIAEMLAQKERARAATKMDAGDWITILEDDREEFIGYEYETAKVHITRYRIVKTKKKTLYQLVFNLTPFYPEGGGQVGDSGKLVSAMESLNITDTKKENGLIIHYAESLPENISAEFDATVDSSKRLQTSYNHTATHLLHQALREVLGEHVEQKGSLVHPDHLRFDFSHFAKMEDAEIAEVERLVNMRIRNNIPLEEHRRITMQSAKEMGAMMLFGEKYGDLVRAIKFEDSVELCGGIHVQATGQIGLFKIVHEGAVASGIRRVEAYTGEKARTHLVAKLDVLDDLSAELKNVKDPLAGLMSLKEENNQLRKEVESFQKEKAQSVKKEWLTKFESHDSYKTLILETDLAVSSIKDILFQLKAEQQNWVAVIATKQGGKAQLAVAISEELAGEKSWHAGNIVRELAKEVKGGGGGQALFATAGGNDSSGISNALKKAKEILK